VRAPDGTRLGIRDHLHPHVEEQPFTRSLAGAAPLVLATLITLFVIWRREFASQSRKILLQS
jgi:hypothetical protein